MISFPLHVSLALGTVLMLFLFGTPLCVVLSCALLQSKRVKAEPSDSPPVNNEQAGASQSGPTNGHDSAHPATAEQPRDHGDTDMAAPSKDSQSAAATAQAPHGQNGSPAQENNESSEDEAPLLSKVEEASRKAANSKRPQKKAAPRKRNADADSSDLSDAQDNGAADGESDFEDDKPLKAAAGKTKAPAKRPAAQPRKSKAAASEDSSAKAPASKAKAPAANKKVKKEATPAASSPVKKPKKEEDGDQSGAEGDEEDDEQKFAFLQGGEDTGEKWKTLEHNGVIFPPEYEPLPEGVKLYYDGTYRSLKGGHFFIHLLTRRCLHFILQESPSIFHMKPKKSLASLLPCLTPTMLRSKFSATTSLTISSKYWRSILLFAASAPSLCGSIQLTMSSLRS